MLYGSKCLSNYHLVTFLLRSERIDLVEERLEILLQLAQLGCDKKSGALCITSVQYENWTHAANLSKELSLFLTGNWSEGFDEKLQRRTTARQLYLTGLMLP